MRARVEGGRGATGAEAGVARPCRKEDGAPPLGGSREGRRDPEVPRPEAFQEEPGPLEPGSATVGGEDTTGRRAPPPS